MAKEEVIVAIMDSGKNAVVPVGITTMDLFGIQLSEWVYILTLVYLIIHIGYIIWKWVKGK